MILRGKFAITWNPSKYIHILTFQNKKIYLVADRGLSPPPCLQTYPQFFFTASLYITHSISHIAAGRSPILYNGTEKKFLFLIPKAAIRESVWDMSYCPKSWVPLKDLKNIFSMAWNFFLLEPFFLIVTIRGHDGHDALPKVFLCVGEKGTWFFLSLKTLIYVYFGQSISSRKPKSLNLL